MSWREARVIETTRSIAAVRCGPLRRADWLLGLVEAALHEAVADPSLPARSRQMTADALAGLQAGRAEMAANPPRPGRPPTSKRVAVWTQLAVIMAVPPGSGNVSSPAGLTAGLRSASLIESP